MIPMRLSNSPWGVLDVSVTARAWVGALSGGAERG